MYKLLIACVILFFGRTFAAPAPVPGHLDYRHYGHDYGHSAHLLAAAPVLHAAPLIKPVVEHVPIYNQHSFTGHDYEHHHVPVYHPIYHHASAPVGKVAAPVVKTYAPATSYATVTTYKVAHVQPIVKAIVPQPTIIKSYVPSYAHDYGYDHHGYGGHGHHY